MDGHDRYPAKLTNARLIRLPAALRNALDVLRDNSVPVISVVLRHIAGDWGVVSNDDKRQNDVSIATGLRLISLKPLPDSAVSVGAILLANETFLRSSVDDAIASLVADGSIGTILERAKFPATPAK